MSHAVRRPCSDFIDMLRHLINRRRIIIIIISIIITGTNTTGASSGKYATWLTYNGHLQKIFQGLTNCSLYCYTYPVDSFYSLTSDALWKRKNDSNCCTQITYKSAKKEMTETQVYWHKSAKNTNAKNNSQHWTLLEQYLESVNHVLCVKLRWRCKLIANTSEVMIVV